MTPVLEVKNLSKRFGSQMAVDQLSFKVMPGQVFGILGPNGSGKTTTLSMVLTLLSPTEGGVQLFGSDDLQAGRKRMGVTLETAGFLPSFSGKTNLKMAALNKGLDPDSVDDLLKKVDLYNDRKKKFKAYSYGMKQRLAIASALLGNPEVLILDEPTNGLDPIGIIEVRKLIQQLAADGKTVIVASHLLSEMEKLCTDIIILAKGRLISSGKLSEILSHYASLEDAFIQLTQVPS
ncbi:MAG TPA: ATP-binding cassette domain-containing protein [Luteibaculaceae bacterium]|nr:ATP-binding cassette domain-containing protein [Luteibaculaceae bacterium]